MKSAVLFACLITLSLGGCAWFPRSGPSAGEVVEQAQAGGEILFDVVPVDEHVVSTLRARPKESFALRFQKDAEAPEVRIAIGDTISVLIWESAAGGLFTEAPTALPSTGGRTGIEPLSPESQPPTGERPREFGAPGPSPSQPAETTTPSENRPAGGSPPKGAFSIAAAAATSGRQPAVIPEQVVGPDGAISVPYAGRIPAAGRSPAEVQQTIEGRLAEKALQPQALVIVMKSAANAVTVNGEVVAGAKIPVSPGGDRLLQVIAAAGGAKAPVYQTFVRVSRGDVTASIPLQQLVSDPAEDIYARPGDVITLVRIPQTFSVFGATGRNAEITFDAQALTLSEALGKSRGLQDDFAKPDAVFLFRYEPDAVVRALGQPIASEAPEGISPVVYRFDFRNGQSFLLGRDFPVYDKDIIFVADAPAAQIYKFFAALNAVTGPVITGFVVCQNTKC
ncbi:MAG: polysaccharide biosynthesis/export family protein [Stellaceae bacterium]